MNQSTIIISASGASPISNSLSQLLDLPHYEVKTDTFPNQELKIRLEQRAETAILVGSFSTPVNSRIIEYLLIADALKRRGCRTIIGVISYLAYSKQDKVFLPGEPLSAKVIASILQTAPLTEILTLDLHNPAISGYFDCPVTNISAVNYLAKKITSLSASDSLVVSPDAGSVKNANRFASALQLPIVFATKQRDLETGKVKFTHLSESVADKNIYIYDDMIATGNTLTYLAEYLKNEGAKTINVFCTHHLYLDGVQTAIDKSPIDNLTVTNSITPLTPIDSPKLKVIDCAPLIAEQLNQ